MLNVVTADLAASLDFYRRLGVDVPEVGDDEVHVELPQPGGFNLEIDTHASARIWHAGFRADPGASGWCWGSGFRRARPSTSGTPS